MVLCWSFVILDFTEELDQLFSLAVSHNIKLNKSNFFITVCLQKI